MKKTTEETVRYILVSSRDAKTKIWIAPGEIDGNIHLVADARPSDGSVGKRFNFNINAEVFRCVIELEEEKDGEEIYYEVYRCKEKENGELILKPSRKTELIFSTEDNNTFTAYYEKNMLIKTLVKILARNSREE